MRISLLSPAKLNLFLYITGKRADHYHNLQTLFQFLDYGDEMTFAATDSPEISLSPAIPNVKNDDNLIIKAATLLQSYAQIKRGVNITIDKKLPLGGGVGGASSNAATTLLALNYVWQCHLSEQTLLTLGRKLGADVPIFIYGHSAFAEDIGDKLTPVDLDECGYLVAYPENTSVSTAALFSDPALERDSPVRSLNTLLNLPFSNTFEPVVKMRYPQIAQIIDTMNPYAPTRLTGTGCCVFSSFINEQAAYDAIPFLPKNTRYFVAKSTSISPVHQKLKTLQKNRI